MLLYRNNANTITIRPLRSVSDGGRNSNTAALSCDKPMSADVAAGREALLRQQAGQPAPGQGSPDDEDKADLDLFANAKNDIRVKLAIGAFVVMTIIAVVGVWKGWVAK